MKKILIAGALTLAAMNLAQAQTPATSQSQPTPKQQGSGSRITAKEAQDAGATQQQIADLEVINNDIAARMADASRLKDSKQRQDTYASLDAERMQRYGKVLSKEQMDRWQQDRKTRQDTVKSGIERRKQSTVPTKKDTLHMNTLPPDRKKN